MLETIKFSLQLPAQLCMCHAMEKSTVGVALRQQNNFPSLVYLCIHRVMKKFSSSLHVLFLYKCKFSSPYQTTFKLSLYALRKLSSNFSERTFYYLTVFFIKICFYLFHYLHCSFLFDWKIFFLFCLCIFIFMILPKIIFIELRTIVKSRQIIFLSKASFEVFVKL